MTQTSISSFHALSNTLSKIIFKLCKSQTTHVTAPSVFTLVHLPPGPLSAPSQGWAPEQLPEPKPKPARRFLLAARRLPSLEDATRENGGFCMAGWSPSHSVQSAAFRRESLRATCDYEPVDGHVHTHTHCKHVCALVHTHWCIYVHKLTVIHIWWIPPAGLCTIRYSTGGKSQLTHLPVPPLGKSSTPESSSRLPHSSAWCLQGQPKFLSLFLSLFLSSALFLFQSPDPSSFLWLSSSKNQLWRNNSVPIQPFSIIWWPQCLPLHKDNSP